VSLSDPTLLILGPALDSSETARSLANLGSVDLPNATKFVITRGKYDAGGAARTFNIDSGYPAEIAMLQSLASAAGCAVRDDPRFRDGYDLFCIRRLLERNAGFDRLLLLREPAGLERSWPEMLAQASANLIRGEQRWLQFAARPCRPARWRIAGHGMGALPLGRCLCDSALRTGRGAGDRAGRARCCGFADPDRRLRDQRRFSLGDVMADKLPPDFNPDGYAAAYPDVALSGLGAKAHYLRFGRLLGRWPSGKAPGAQVKDSAPAAAPRQPVEAAPPEPVVEQSAAPRAGAPATASALVDRPADFRPEEVVPSPAPAKTAASPTGPSASTISSFGAGGGSSDPLRLYARMVGIADPAPRKGRDTDPVRPAVEGR
jgi:hypothetical protein